MVLINSEIALVGTRTEQRNGVCRRQASCGGEITIPKNSPSKQKWRKQLELKGSCAAMVCICGGIRDL